MAVECRYFFDGGCSGFDGFLASNGFQRTSTTSCTLYLQLSKKTGGNEKHIDPIMHVVQVSCFTQHFLLPQYRSFICVSISPSLLQ